MPPQSTTNGVPSTQSNGRKRPLSSRVLPAIPLALSKSKSAKSPAKPQPKSEADARRGGEVQSAVDEENIEATESATRENHGIDGAAETERPLSEQLSGTNGDALSVDTESNSLTTSVQEDETLPSAPPPDTIDTPPASVETSSPKTAVSPMSSRKPTDKFDMRQIKTELPPAFVPLAAGMYTPQSATSSNQTNRNFHPYAHPSTSSIVFGGQDSLNTSPAPYQNSQNVPPDHIHHNSEPHVQQRSFPPGIVPPVAPWNMRPHYPQHQSHSSVSHSHSHSHSHGHQSFRYPPREIFTPNEPPQHDRLRSRSGSQASFAHIPRAAEDLQSPTTAGAHSDYGRVMYHEQYGSLSSQHPVRQFSHHMHQSPGPAQSPPMDMWNLHALRNHIESHFSNPILADCHLHITEDHASGRQYFDGHKIILSRSQTLLDLIKASPPPSSAALSTQVHVRLQDKNVRIRPLVESLKYLYGGQLPLANAARHPGFDAESMAINGDRMQDALQFIATGEWLRMPIIAARNVEVAAYLLHWDNISTALSFALEGGLAQAWSAYSPEDGSEDKLSTTSSDDSLSRLEIAGSPKYDPHSTALLQRVVQFIVQVLPPDFYLDSSAPELSNSPRLPAVPSPPTPSHESRLSRSDPRLSKIRFGDIPAEDHQRPSYVKTTSSSILLSLPFTVLKYMLEHLDLATRLGPETVASIMRQVVAEREIRRTKVLKARVAANYELTQNLYWEESVEPSRLHSAGFRLARRRKGIETPSSGADSDQSK